MPILFTGPKQMSVFLFSQRLCLHSQGGSWRRLCEVASPQKKSGTLRGNRYMVCTAKLKNLALLSVLREFPKYMSVKRMAIEVGMCH